MNFRQSNCPTGTGSRYRRRCRVCLQSSCIGNHSADGESKAPVQSFQEAHIFSSFSSSPLARICLVAPCGVGGAGPGIDSHRLSNPDDLKRRHLQELLCPDQSDPKPQLPLHRSWFLALQLHPPEGSFLEDVDTGWPERRWKKFPT